METTTTKVGVSQLWNDTQTPSTSTLGYKKGGKMVEDNLGQDHPAKDLKIRWLSEEENGKDTEETTQNSNVYRRRVPRQDFSHHGRTESC